MKHLALLVIVLMIGVYSMTAQDKPQDLACSVHDNKLATVGPRIGQIDVYWVNGNGAISTAYWVNGGWSDEFSVSPDGSAVAGSPVEALVPRGDQVDVYWISPNGEIRTAFWAGQWSETFSATPPNVAASNSSLEALVPRGDQVDLYWVSPEGAIKSTFWTGQWNPVITLTPDHSVRSGSPLKAIVPRGDQVDLYWVSPEGAIMSMYYANGWSQPFAITPANVANANTDLEAIGTLNWAGVYWVDPNNALMYATWNSGSSVWSNPQSITEPNSILTGATLAIAGGFDPSPNESNWIPDPYLFWSNDAGILSWGSIDNLLSVTETNREPTNYNVDGVERLGEYGGNGPESCAAGYDTGFVSWTTTPSSRVSYITFFSGGRLQLVQVAGFLLM